MKTYEAKYNGDFMIRYAVVETGEDVPFYEVREYNNQHDFDSDMRMMTGVFLLETHAVEECDRLNNILGKYPNSKKEAVNQ